jgi:predicted Rossmann fold nucleotide-binding protein DprA/Smf involved in DNA uptake
MGDIRADILSTLRSSEEPVRIAELVFSIGAEVKEVHGVFMRLENEGMVYRVDGGWVAVPEATR